MRLLVLELPYPCGESFLSLRKVCRMMAEMFLLGPILKVKFDIVKVLRNRAVIHVDIVSAILFYFK